MTGDLGTIDNWYPTLPLDPTTDDVSWLEELASEHGITMEWRGLTFLDTLAADHPKVIDYYLNNGLARVEALSSQFNSTLQLLVAAKKEEGSPAPLQASEAMDGLRSIHAALNAIDPHYRYDFAVSGIEPLLTEEPDLVAAVFEYDGTNCVTFKIYALSRAAYTERPITVEGSLKAEPESEFADEIASFFKYGAPLDAPLGSSDLNIKMPGGLGGPLVGAAIKIGPANGPGYGLRLRLLDPSGGLIQEIELSMSPASVGVDQTGVRAHGTDKDGVFQLEILTDLSNKNDTNFKLRGNDLTGLRPRSLLPALRLLSQLNAPNSLQVALPEGPATTTPIPLSDPEPPAGAAETLALVESLAVIQRHTSTQITVPDLETVSSAELHRIERAARLLNGDSINEGLKGTLAGTMTMEGEVSVGQMIRVEAEEPLTVDIGDSTINLGVIDRISALEVTKLEPSGINEWQIEARQAATVPSVARLKS